MASSNLLNALAQQKRVMKELELLVQMSKQSPIHIDALVRNKKSFEKATEAVYDAMINDAAAAGMRYFK